MPRRLVACNRRIGTMTFSVGAVYDRPYRELLVPISPIQAWFIDEDLHLSLGVKVMLITLLSLSTTPTIMVFWPYFSCQAVIS